MGITPYRGLIQESPELIISQFDLLPESKKRFALRIVVLHFGGRLSMKYRIRYKRALPFVVSIVAFVLLVFGTTPILSSNTSSPSEPFVTIPIAYGTVAGTTTGVVTIQSDDPSKGCSMEIPAATTATLNGQPVTQVYITPMGTNLPAPLPADKTHIALVYEFGPPGTHFNKPVTVCLEFNTADIPAGETPVIVRWSESAGEWVEIGGTVSDANHICVEITDFSVYTVVSVVKGINWYLIGGIAGGCALLIIIFLVIWYRRRRAIA